MDYTIRVLRKCKEYGFKVYMDPHQDIVSVYSTTHGSLFSHHENALLYDRCRPGSARCALRPGMSRSAFDPSPLTSLVDLFNP